MTQLIWQNFNKEPYNMLRYILITVIFLILPFFVPTYLTTLFIQIIIYSILAMSTDLLIGYSGMFSMGQAAFWGTGAYMTAFLVLNGVEFYPVVIVGVILAVVFISGLLGFVSVRASGIYFLLVSFAFAEMMFAVVWTQRQWTRGDLGLSGIQRPYSGFPFYLDQSLNFYFFALIHLIICYIILRMLVRSPFGLICQGIRENESRMRSFGYNILKYKTVVFIIAAIFSSIAGSLSAYFNRFVSPDDMGFFNSAMGVLMVVIGGTGTLTGAILGAAIITVIKFFFSIYTQHWPVIIGSMFIVCIIFFPKGIGEYLFRIKVLRRQ